VEIAKRAVDAFNRGDMDEAFALFDPNVRWTTADDEPDPQTYVGHEGVRQLIASLLDIWEQGFTMKAHEFIDLGDVVVVPFTSHVQARGSGVPIPLLRPHLRHQVVHLLAGLGGQLPHFFGRGQEAPDKALGDRAHRCTGGRKDDRRREGCTDADQDPGREGDRQPPGGLHGAQPAGRRLVRGALVAAEERASPIAPMMIGATPSNAI